LLARAAMIQPNDWDQNLGSTDWIFGMARKEAMADAKNFGFG
jgi:hypothetical protein